jgi:DNA-binding transcriptional LysR family regulator
MDLRHLRYFVALAEELHFGRAAERLYIAQPGLSQQIGQLERELGVKLFYRSNRQVQLTSAGELFLVEARRAVEQVDKAAAVARRASAGDIGELRIGYNKQAHEILSRLLHEFRARNDQIVLTLDFFDTTPAILDALLRNDIEVGVGLGPLSEAHTQTRVIMREELLVALPCDHPLTRLTAIPMSRLANEQWVRWKRELNPPLYDSLSAFFNQAGFVPDVKYNGLQTEEVYMCVASGLAVSLVAEGTAKSIAAKGVAVRKLLEPTPSWDHILIWLTGDVGPVLQRFLDLERELDKGGTEAIEPQFQIQGGLVSRNQKSR